MDHNTQISDQTFNQPRILLSKYQIKEKMNPLFSESESSDKSIPSISPVTQNLQNPSSYKEQLIKSSSHYFENWLEKLLEEEELQEDPLSSTILQVQFQPEQLKQMRQAWKRTLIIKLHGRGLNFQGAGEKLAQLW